ncbi:MAG TPA: CocE/NonD family hydrolase C-terminal non-catalytic domain-containing protein, partial [Gemmatimonadaceae bacterium]|nr:CocE/NonD family hydrolase C-terminal non-catalytic domain-containing protein [Gemmatimonadaceae bacterium]
AIDTWNAIQFVSPQLAGPFELSGSFSGRVDLITNKPHFDFQISLYELTSSGDYNLVSLYSTRSARTDSSQNTPLQTGVRQNLDYASDSRTSHTVQNGSRLVVLISILKEPNTSNGEGVGLDASELLRIRWYGESYIELHVRRR